MLTRVENSGVIIDPDATDVPINQDQSP